MQDARLLGRLVDRRRALQRLRCHAVARRRLQGVEDTLNGGRVQSGGVQQCGKRPQPAQRELHLSVRGWFLVVRLYQAASPLGRPLAAAAAARVGGFRGGLQRASMCLIVLTRAPCASLVPRSARSASASALATSDSVQRPPLYLTFHDGAPV